MKGKMMAKKTQARKQEKTGAPKQQMAMKQKKVAAMACGGKMMKKGSARGR